MDCDCRVFILNPAHITEAWNLCSNEHRTKSVELSAFVGAALLSQLRFWHELR